MASGEAVDPEQARRMVASNEATVLDIRDDDAWREKRIPGARHAGEGELEGVLDQIAEESAVIVVGEDDERSAEVAAKLREQGREAASLEGGMDAWEKENFPLQPSTDPDDDVPV